MQNPDRLSHRRAIESLRSGVPGRDAVQALGSRQPDIEAKFLDLLEGVQDQLSDPEGRNIGLLIAGDFGSGKSHLLEHMAQTALSLNFVCSRVVISKETPLYDPARFFRAAAEAAIVPGKRGNAMTEVVAALRSSFHSRTYTDFYHWAHTDPGLSALFPASLCLIERMYGYPEVISRVVRFLGGDKFNVGDIRRYLRAAGEGASYRFAKVTPRDLALQKFRFVARLTVAAGYRGWLLLVDEAELIARYSLLSRAKSYAEVARWLGKSREPGMPGLACVCAMTEDFVRTVIDERDDFEKAPNRLRASVTPLVQAMADDAERGIRALRSEVLSLRPPTRADVAATYESVREIYSQAYGWQPPIIETTAYAASTRMRQHVRGWITEWDLMRLSPGYRAVIQAVDFHRSMVEDEEL